MKHKLEKICEDLGEERWAKIKTATKLFFPSLESTQVLPNIRITYETTQVITSHSYLNGHKHRVKLAASPICAFGKAEETVQPFLFMCELHDDLGKWPPNLQEIPKNHNLWQAMANYISKTKRLKNNGKTMKTTA